MAFNPALHSATMLAIVSASKSLHRLDIQNAFRFANWMLPESARNKELTSKNLEDFKYNIFTLLDWADILGNGFTTYKPEKLKKYLEKYSSKKYFKLQKFILKNYDDNLDMSDKELNEWCQDALECLDAFILLSIALRNEDSTKLLTKLDKEYYNYAKEEFDKLIYSLSEE